MGPQRALHLHSCHDDGKFGHWEGSCPEKKKSELDIDKGDEMKIDDKWNF